MRALLAALVGTVVVGCMAPPDDRLTLDEAREGYELSCDLTRQIMIRQRDAELDYKETGDESLKALAEKLGQELDAESKATAKFYRRIKELEKQ